MDSILVCAAAGSNASGGGGGGTAVLTAGNAGADAARWKLPVGARFKGAGAAFESVADACVAAASAEQ